MVLWHLDRSHQLLNSHQTFIIFSHQQWADTQSHQNEMSLLLCSFQNTIWCQQKNTSKWFTGSKKTSEKLNSGRIIYCTWNQTSAYPGGHTIFSLLLFFALFHASLLYLDWKPFEADNASNGFLKSQKAILLQWNFCLVVLFWNSVRCK